MAVADDTYAAPTSWDDCDWDDPAGDSADCMLALRQAVAERAAVALNARMRMRPLEFWRAGRGDPLSHEACLGLTEAVFGFYSGRYFLDPDTPVAHDDGGVRPNALSAHGLPASCRFWVGMPGAGSTPDAWGDWLLDMKSAIDRLHVVQCGVWGGKFAAVEYAGPFSSTAELKSELNSRHAAAWDAFEEGDHSLQIGNPSLTNMLELGVSDWGDGEFGYAGLFGAESLTVRGAWHRHHAVRAKLGYGLWCRGIGGDAEFENNDWDEGYSEGELGLVDERTRLAEAVELGSHDLLTIPASPAGSHLAASEVDFVFHLDFAVSGGFKFQEIT